MIYGILSGGVFDRSRMVVTPSHLSWHYRTRLPSPAWDLPTLRCETRTTLCHRCRSRRQSCRPDGAAGSRAQREAARHLGTFRVPLRALSLVVRSPAGTNACEAANLSSLSKRHGRHDEDSRYSLRRFAGTGAANTSSFSFTPSPCADVGVRAGRQPMPSMSGSNFGACRLLEVFVVPRPTYTGVRARRALNEGTVQVDAAPAPERHTVGVRRVTLCVLCRRQNRRRLRELPP